MAERSAISEQLQIVEKTDELMALCDTLDSHLEAGTRLNAALMESLVHQLAGDSPDDDNDPNKYRPIIADLPEGRSADQPTVIGAGLVGDEIVVSAHDLASSVDSRFQEAVLVAKLGLTETRVAKAMREIEKLFPASPT